MIVLIAGLVLFLGIHSVRILAPQWRAALIARHGEGPWKGVYSLLALVGLVLMVWGYALYWPQAPDLYAAPSWARSLAFIAMPVALLLIMASNFPPGYIRRFVRHPMLVGTIFWSAVHLLNNGDLASLLLFGAFLIWAVADLFSAATRTGTVQVDVRLWPDLLSLALALLLTWMFIAFAHAWLFGAPLS